MRGSVANDGLVTCLSSHDFTTTLDRLINVLTQKHVTIFAQIDHAAGAASVGQPLRPTTLIIFGNPAAGTPLMQAAQPAGIDLPLKALVWQDRDGSVKLTYNDPKWIAARHGAGGQVDETLVAMSAVLEALARTATG